MTKGVWIAGIVAGLVVFVWGSVSHMVIGWHESSVAAFPNESVFIEALKREKVESGMYVLPYPEDAEERMKAMEEGPLMFASVRTEGSDPFMTNLMITLLVDLIAALTAAWIVARLAGNAMGTRVCVVVAVAFFAMLWGPVMNHVWWGFSFHHTMVNVVDGFITWTLAGLVIAKLLPAQT